MDRHLVLYRGAAGCRRFDIAGVGRAAGAQACCTRGPFRIVREPSRRVCEPSRGVCSKGAHLAHSRNMVVVAPATVSLVRLAVLTSFLRYTPHTWLSGPVISLAVP